MGNSIISTTVVSTVDPGYSGYATGITITNTGGIIPANGGPGISDFGVPASAAIYNAGIILSTANYGIKHSGSTTITNRGTIIGMGNPSDGIFVYGNAVIKNIGTTALINGYQYAVALLGGTATVANQGRITGFGGINLQAGGFVTNSSAALIKAADAGIEGAGGAVTVLNAGSITSSTETGVRFSNGGYLFNQGTAALVTGSRYGMTNYGDFGTLVNQGTVIGAVDSGFYASGLGDSATNASGAVLEGGKFGFHSNAQATLVNAGSVLATGTGGSDAGVQIVASGLVINQAGGVIASNYAGIAWQNGLDTLVNLGSIVGGSGFGVKLSTGGTITNAGTIGGGAGAVLLGGLNPSALIIDPGAAFHGLVTVAGTSALLEFATLAGVNTGTLDLGTSFNGFTDITFAAGSTWSDEGGIGVFDTAAIAGFTIGDTILLDGFSVNPLDTSYVTGVGLELTSTAGTTITLHIAGSFTTGNFVVVDPPGTTTITVQEVFPLVSIISTTVVSTVHPGIGTYASGITITNTGQISTSSYGIFGSAAVAGIAITNFGTVNSAGQTGIYLYATGTVNNAGTSALISGVARYGVDFYKGFGTVINQGSIIGRGGVILQEGGMLTNDAGAVIAASLVEAVAGYGTGAGLTLMNAGTISGGSSGKGVGELRGGYIGNTSSAARISGGTDGIAIYGLAATVMNDGTVIGSLGSGVYLAAASQVTNAASALLAGFYSGVRAGVAATVINHGTVTAFGTPGLTPVSGIELERGGLIENVGSAAVIASQYYGIDVTNGYGTVINQGTIIGKADYGINLVLGGTLSNAGTIGGGKGAIHFGVFTPARLIIDQGAMFNGGVTALSSVATLEFAAATGSSVGSLDLGGSFSGFSAIALDAGARWSLEGSIAAFDSQTITGFSFGDTIVLDNFVVNTLDTTYVSGIGLALTDTAGNHITLDIAGNFSTASFIVIDPPGTTTIEAVCYLRGTRIATPGGERAIEMLRPGDAVITKFGGYRQIKWIGRQSYARRFISNNCEQLPVRICKGALGGGLPRRDLFVSPGHSMLIDGVLVLARCLINGITIRQDECPEQVDYFQLEFESHDCVLAEGAWSESYADTPDWRNKFHNAAEFYALFPGHVAPPVQSLCAERPLHGPALARVLQKLVMQAGFAARPGPLRGFIDYAQGGLVSGWAQDEAHPLLPVQLEIWSGGVMAGVVLACDERADLTAAGIGRGACAFTFTLPPGIDEADIQLRRVSDGAALPFLPMKERHVA